MKLYVLNALITPYDTKKDETAVFIMKRMDKNEVMELFKMSREANVDIVSAIGHQSTSDFLKEIFPEEIGRHFTYNRKSIYFEEGDLGLVFRVTTRGDTFKEHTIEDLRTFHTQNETEFLLISRVYHPEITLNPYFSKVEG
jgi:hypothetical protein